MLGNHWLFIKHAHQQTYTLNILDSHPTKIGISCVVFLKYNYMQSQQASDYRVIQGLDHLNIATFAINRTTCKRRHSNIRHVC